MPDRHTDTAATPAPAPDDTLRERLAGVLIEHMRVSIESCRCGWGANAGNLGQSHALHVTDVALLPLIREHVAAAWRDARADEKAVANAALDAARKEQARAKKSEAAIERVRELCDNAIDLFEKGSPFPHRAVRAAYIRAALDGSEGTDG